VLFPVNPVVLENGREGKVLADSASSSASFLIPTCSAEDFTHDRNSMWFPGRYLRKSFNISVRGDEGMEIWRRLSLSGTFEAE